MVIDIVLESGGENYKKSLVTQFKITPLSYIQSMPLRPKRRKTENTKCSTSRNKLGSFTMACSHPSLETQSTIIITEICSLIHWFFKIFSGIGFQLSSALSYTHLEKCFQVTYF